jgi:hypothetical protein
MARRPIITTQEYLISTPLPEATDTYTVISHETIINETKQLLSSKGFEVVRELYRCNEGAQVAQGVYHLKYGEDPDMSLMFAWNNSYDKSMKFKCSVGGYVHASLSSVIGSNMGAWVRKHTGTADEEAVKTLSEQINNAELYFKQLVHDKEIMKTIPVTPERRAEIVGRMYLINELVTGEQLVVIRSEFNKPSFVYNGVENSVWAMYNAIIYALQKSHPKTWMDQQRVLHWMICKEFGISPLVIESTEPEPVEEKVEEVKGEVKFTEEAKAKFQEIVTEHIEIAIKEELNNLHDHHPTPLPEFKEVEFDIQKDTGFEQQLSQGYEFAEPEPTVDDLIDNVDVWPCLKCNTLQGASDTYHEGQLCTSCYEEGVNHG